MVLERDYVVVSNHGEKWLVDHEYASPFLYHALVPSTLAAEVALKFGAQGPSVVVSTGCTSGIDGIGYGHQLIQDGEADIVISGASETGISPDLDGLLRPDQGDVPAERRRGARLAPVRPRPRRLRDGRGLRDPRPGGVRGRAGARRAHLLRGRGLREPRQRVPHDRPPSRRRRDVGGDPRRDGAGRTSSPRTSTTSTRTARGRSRTTATRPPRTSARSATRRTRSRSARSSR